MVTSFITEYDLISHNITRFPTSSNPHQFITLPYWIASSETSDKKSFWFNEHTGNRISLFNSTDMTLTEYEVPTRDPLNGYLANALTLAINPKNNNKIWFTEFNHDKIGVVDHDIPIPFDIHATTAKNDNNDNASKAVVLSQQSNQTQERNAKIKIEITRKADDSKGFSNMNHTHIVFLNATSSMSPRAKICKYDCKLLSFKCGRFDKNNKNKKQRQ